MKGGKKHVKRKEMWSLWGWQEGSTTKDNFSISCKNPSEKIPLRYWESEVVDATNCLFSCLLLKHLHFRTNWITKAEASRRKTGTDFPFGHSVVAWKDATMKLKLWIIYKTWWMLLSNVPSRVVPNLNPQLYYSQQVLDIAIIQWKNDFFWTR